jgi:hypothetical protein
MEKIGANEIIMISKLNEVIIAIEAKYNCLVFVRIEKGVGRLFIGYEKQEDSEVGIKDICLFYSFMMDESFMYFIGMLEYSLISKSSMKLIDAMISGRHRSIDFVRYASGSVMRIIRYSHYKEIKDDLLKRNDTRIVAFLKGEEGKNFDSSIDETDIGSYYIDNKVWFYV